MARGGRVTPWIAVQANLSAMFRVSRKAPLIGAELKVLICGSDWNFRSGRAGAGGAIDVLTGATRVGATVFPLKCPLGTLSQMKKEAE